MPTPNQNSVPLDGPPPNVVETWRTVPGYPTYQVSDLGRVRSLDKRLIDKLGRPRFFRGQLLNPTKVKCGHLWVPLCHNGVERIFAVHQLVLLAFIGPCPVGMEGCHTDDIGSNNKLTNLAWGTHAKNMADRSRNNPKWLLGAIERIQHFNATATPQQRRGRSKKLDAEKVRKIRRMRATGKSFKVIASHFNITVGTAHCIATKKTWSYI